MGSGPRAGPEAGNRPQETEIGDLVGPVGTVDDRGTVKLVDRSWRLEWAAGSEDRWRVAAVEVGVRRSLLDDTPVTVTAMPVPGGDVVQRVGGVSDGMGRAVSIEIANDSPGPVSVALAVRPEGEPGIGSVAVEGERLIVGRDEVLVVGRGPGGSAAVDDDDVWAAVRSGPSPGDVSRRSRTGSAAAAVVVPVPHRRQVGFVLPVAGPLPAPPVLSSVAAGWRAVADRGASLEIRDPDTMARWRRDVPALVLAAGTTDVERSAAVAPVLDLVGLPDEADRARATLVDGVELGLVTGTAAAATARALASRRLRSGRPSGLAELAAVLTGAAGRELTRSDLDLMADALDHEDERVARDVRELDVPRSISPSTEPGRRMGSLLDVLVSETATGLDLLPEPPSAWKRRSVDVSGLATRHGVVAYSIRWHGERPALLWELESDRSPTIRCPGLDPAWSSNEASGEALLGAV